MANPKGTAAWCPLGAGRVQLLDQRPSGPTRNRAPTGARRAISRLGESRSQRAPKRCSCLPSSSAGGPADPDGVRKVSEKPRARGSLEGPAGDAPNEPEGSSPRSRASRSERQQPGVHQAQRGGGAREEIASDPLAMAPGRPSHLRPEQRPHRPQGAGRVRTPSPQATAAHHLG